MSLKSRLKRRLKFIAENIGLHGVKFLVSDFHWGYKAIWLTTLMVFLYMMQSIILTTLQHSKSDSVVINIDTAYLRWENSFPSAAICFRKDRSFKDLSDFLDEYFRDNPPSKKRSFYKFAQSYAFMSVSKAVSDIEMDVCLAYNATCGLNLDVIQAKVMPTKCSEFFSNVKYLGEEKKCEDFWKLEHTEVGVCFTTSWMTQGLKYNRKNPPPVQFEFEYMAREGFGLDLYIFSPGEFVTPFDQPYAIPKQGTTFLSFLTTETESSKEIISVDPSIRKCKFPSEKTNIYKFSYSVANCTLEQRIHKEINACNCTLPVIRKPDFNYCDIYGLNCLKNVGNFEIDEENCVSLCTEMQISGIGHFVIENPSLQNKGKIIIEISNQPNTKYIRSLMKNNLDIIVICSSIVGLFTGGSLLSLLETLYLFVFRKYTAM